MNEKLNVPGEIFLGDQHYSWRSDWQVNGWLMVATLISAFCDIIFAQKVRHWAVGWQVGMVAAQFIALLLWARSLVRWIRGMDEMHARITTNAVLFAVSATFLVLFLWHRLWAAGFFDVVFTKPHGGGSWDMLTVTHGFLFLTLFYFIGHSLFNRRFK